MKESKLEPVYSGSEVDFPVVAGMMCHSCLTNLPKFTDHKPKYTKELVQEILNRIKAAGRIPNIEQRQAKSVSLSKPLAAAAGTSADNFTLLGSYIESAFKEEAAIMKKMAGGTYYDNARRNWSDASTMNNMMLTFIDTYNSDLTQAGMPATFAEKCTTDSNTFSNACDAYEDYKGTSEQEREAKINANNAIYTSLKDIMSDGKVIYKKDEALRKQFTYSAILSKVVRNKRSGFTIKVYAPEGSNVVKTAELRLNGYTNPFKGSKSGIITAKVPEGIFTGVITAPGFSPLGVKYISDKGVTHRNEVTLSLAAGKQDIA